MVDVLDLLDMSYPLIIVCFTFLQMLEDAGFVDVLAEDRTNQVNI